MRVPSGNARRAQIRAAMVDVEVVNLTVHEVDVTVGYPDSGRLTITIRDPE